LPIMSRNSGYRFSMRQQALVVQNGHFMLVIWDG
jgi:hypothetical protein